MPVREVLATHTSLELAEWNAYERAYGPIDDDWRDENSAQIHELLQSLLYAFGGEGTPEPRHKTRPSEMWGEYQKSANSQND